MLFHLAFLKDEIEVSQISVTKLQICVLCKEDIPTVNKS